MRTIRRSRSVLDRLPDPLRNFATRRSAEITGFLLMGAVLAIVAALMTWTVDDPSLNNATTGTVQNMLGRPGAIIADLAMQISGIGILAALLPPFVWGLRLIRQHRLERTALRLALWVAGSAAAAAVASALPVTARWPLPTGLGGMVGDALLNGTRNIVGLSLSPFGGLVGFIYAAIAILAITAASGFGFAAESADFQDEDTVDRDADDQLASRDDEPRLGVVLLGWCAHGVLSLKSALIRRLSAQRPQLAGMPRQMRDLESGHTGRARQEPQLGQPDMKPHLPMPAAAPVSAPASRVMVPEPYASAEGSEEELDHHPVTATRVAAPPPAPRPGKRMVKEAQPSLLDRDTFTLPALAFLAEPKVSPVPTVSSEALEQNATLLEGVLDDFGVRGEIIQVRPGPVVTLYELEPAPGTKSSRVISLADDIARSMSAISARVAVVQGKNAIGVELPNAKRETVYLRELLASQDFEGSKHKLALCLGKTIGGEPVIADLARMPHLLGGGHHRLRQVGCHQYHDPVDPLSAEARAVSPDHGRPEDARTVSL